MSITPLRAALSHAIFQPQAAVQPRACHIRVQKFPNHRKQIIKRLQQCPAKDNCQDFLRQGQRSLQPVLRVVGLGKEQVGSRLQTIRAQEVTSILALSRIDALQLLVWATLGSKATGLFQPRAE